MTDSIQINTGEKKILINDDPNRYIVFNPTDVAFAERFQSVYMTLRIKVNDFEKRAKEIDQDNSLDENNIPVNADKRLAFLRETCEYMRSQIDELFGAGTSQTVFGDALGLDMFEQFFSGITPFITAARDAKIIPYKTPRKAGSDGAALAKLKGKKPRRKR